PRRRGVWTASGPSRPWMRARVRAARWGVWVSSPQTPSWGPAAGATPAGGGGGGFGAEQALDAGEGAGGPLGGLGLLAPEPELAAAVGDDLVGDQDQVGEGPGGAAGPAGQPAVELPADPLGHDGGHPRRGAAGVPGRRRGGGAGDRGGAGGAGRRADRVVAPDPGEGLAPVGPGLDAQAGAGQAQAV